MARAVTGQAARLVSSGAAVIAGSVLADSSIEHYRGSFDNRAMVLPLASAALSLVTDGASAMRAGQTPMRRVATPVHLASMAVGAAGFGFHAWNILRQPGGITWQTMFYNAPIGAPAALILSGVLGSAAKALDEEASNLGPVPLLSGQALAGATALGIAGSAAEAALLHFRGAYHNPAMWAPVTMPPLAAAALAYAALTGRVHWITTAALAATAALGLIGVGFHVYGVARNMGGWRNWRQNLLVGPPIPAPPAFTGLSIAGLGALLLMRRFGRG